MSSAARSDATARTVPTLSERPLPATFAVLASVPHAERRRMIFATTAVIIGTILEIALYGFYIVLFFVTLAKRVALGLTLFLFMLITAHAVLGFCYLYEGLVGDGDPESFFLDLSNLIYVSQLAVYCLLRITVDSLLVWRLTLVWGRQLWVVLPALLVFCDFIASCIGCYYNSQIHFIGDPAFIKGLVWITVTFCLSCSTNILVTVLIAHRVIQNNRALKPFAVRTSLTPIMVVVVESAAIYTTLNVIGLVLLVLEDFGVGILLRVISPIIGIVYSLIFIQIVHGVVKPGSGYNEATPTLHLIFLPVSDEAVVEDRGITDNVFPLRTIVSRRSGVVPDHIPMTGSGDVSYYPGVQDLHPPSSMA